jgi:hypothetical protein
MSTNQISAPPKISQLDSEGLGVQPIRFQGAGNSTNQVSRVWNFNESHDFGVPFLSNQVLRGWEFSQSGFKSPKL